MPGSILIFAQQIKMDSGLRRNDETGQIEQVTGDNEMIDGFLALYIFMLAAFTGKEIIGRVPVILHTPLMSGSNFVHGIVLVGAMIALAYADSPLAKAIGFVGVALGAGNAAGGYVVTERMLEMFKSSKDKDKSK
jgi:NAD(P) transhydrogenase subunit alpha